jgi:dienelactone hydrolase
MKALPKVELTRLAVFNATSQNQKTNQQKKRSSSLLIVRRRSNNVADLGWLMLCTLTVFGWEFRNIRLLADNYAKAGFYCYIPDVHQGDSLPISLLQNVEPPLKDQEKAGIVDKAKNAAIIPVTLGPWLVKHREGVAAPIISGFINTVRNIPGTNSVGAIGFCWGGRYAILQAHGKKEGSVGGVDAAYACHPSLVAIPGDFDPVTKPLSLALGTKDSFLDENQVKQIQESMSKKTDMDIEIKVCNFQYPRCDMVGVR